MRSGNGPARLIVYCRDFRCFHSVVVDAKPWRDGVRPSDIEPKFAAKGSRHPTSALRDRLLRLARKAETGAHINEWLSSPAVGLRNKSRTAFLKTRLYALLIAWM
jgi:hypothetical protein